MKNIITFDKARELAKAAIVNIVNYPEYVNINTVLLEDSVIFEKRFWGFFWNHTNIPVQDYWTLRAGFVCFINDRGEIRFKHDIRNTPDEIDECIAGMTKWAERPE